MKKGENDRRVQRTRRLLQEALTALMLEKSYDDITVQDIIDRADVGRSTFYAHFLDKEDLLLSGFETLRKTLGEHVHKTKSAQASSAPSGIEVIAHDLFEHVDEYKPLYKVWVGRHDDQAIIRKVHNYLSDIIQNLLKAEWGNPPDSKIPFELLHYHTANSLLGLLIWWLHQDIPCSAEEMSQIFKQLVLQPVRAAIPAIT